MARTSAKAKKLKQDPKKSNITNENAAPEEKKPDSKVDTGDSTDKENEENNYEVEKIIHTRLYRGKRQYLVRWKGYKEDSDTWENESTVQSCTEALEIYKKNHPPKADSDSEAEDDRSHESEEEEVKDKKRTKTPTKSGKKSKKSKSQKPKEEVKEERRQLSSDSEDEIDKASEKESKKKINKVDEVKKAPIKGAKKILKKKSNIKTEESKNKKKEQSDDSDDESVTDGKNYEVDRIVEVHWKRDGSREFLIRWKGYKPSDDTWEPEAHLDCRELIEKFMTKVVKAKSIPARELRETRTPTDKYTPDNKGRGRSNLRNKATRPSYTE